RCREHLSSTAQDCGFRAPPRRLGAPDLICKPTHDLENLVPIHGELGWADAPTRGEFVERCGRLRCDPTKIPVTKYHVRRNAPLLRFGPPPLLERPQEIRVCFPIRG